MTRRKRFLLISIIPRDLNEKQALNELIELKSLVETFGGEVIELIIQNREVHDKGSYIGEGKLKEAERVISEKRIDVAVLNGIIKPGQIFDMQNVFRNSTKKIEVWDRVDLILQIFSKHANTKEAKLQIELAAMRHMGPRIYGTGMELSRQSGGIGTRGIGETNTELMKRHWHTRMKIVRDKLNKLATERKRQMLNRKRLGMKSVSIVGYTNAGKTTLFNYLTNKNKHVHDALFVTLDSATGKVYLPNKNKEILLSDTIGFIKNLPISLVDAFKSTLLESINADILLHVVDSSDEDFRQKMQTVEKILKDLGLDKKNKIYVFNKADKLNKLNSQIFKKVTIGISTCFISSKTGKGIDELLGLIENQIDFNQSDNHDFEVLPLIS